MSFYTQQFVLSLFATTSTHKHADERQCCYWKSRTKTRTKIVIGLTVMKFEFDCFDRFSPIFASPTEKSFSRLCKAISEADLGGRGPCPQDPRNSPFALLPTSVWRGYPLPTPASNVGVCGAFMLSSLGRSICPPSFQMLAPPLGYLWSTIEA